MKYVELEIPVLFLEFFVREVNYYGKDKATGFPPHTLFYTGKSIAARSEKSHLLPKAYKAKFSTKPAFGFRDNQLCVLDERHMLKSFTEHCHQKSLLDTILLVGQEAFTQEC